MPQLNMFSYITMTNWTIATLMLILVIIKNNLLPSILEYIMMSEKLPKSSHFNKPLYNLMESEGN